MDSKQYFKSDNEERIYKTPYGDIPSVTTILELYDGGKSGALMGWSVKVMAEYLKARADRNGTITIRKGEADAIFKEAKAYHKRLKEKSADIGSAVHNLIEVYLKRQRYDGLLEENPDLCNPFNAFREWEKDLNLEVVATETQVCSELGFAGTLDCLAKINGKLYLIDFKSTTMLKEVNFWQIAAYKECVERGKIFIKERGWVDSNYEVEGLGVLRLDKNTGIPEWKECPLCDWHDHFDCFMALNHIWHINKRRSNGAKL